MDEANLAPGRLVDRYVVEALLGTGGLAEVYRVRHVELGSVHALKLLTWRRKTLDERLLREGVIQANLRHPNVVTVTDVLRIDGQIALVMEYVHGTTLEGVLAQRGRLPLDEALALFAPVLAAVAWAHDAGALHRDLKPANVLLAQTPVGWVPKVADFGIGKLADEMASGSRTRSGVSMGTPGYMAPEQVKDSASVDRRADVFALGVILYEMLTGRQPFAGPDGQLDVTSTVVVTAPPADEVVPEIPRAIAEALARAMAREREGRFDDVRAFALALGLGGHPLFADPGDGVTLGRPFDGRTSSWPALTPPDPAAPETSPAPTLLPSPADQTVLRSGAALPPSRSGATTPEPPAAPPAPAVERPKRSVLPLALGGVVLVLIGAAGLAGLAAVGGLVAWTAGGTSEPPVSAPVSAPVAPVAAAPAPPTAPSAPAPAPAEPPPVAPAPSAAPAPAPAPPTPAPVVASPAPAPAAPEQVVAAPEPPAPAPVAPAPEPAPVEDAVAVAPAPAPAAFDPMGMLGTGSWKGKASGRPFELRFLSAAEGTIKAQAVFVGATRTVEELTGTFDGRRLSLRNSSVRFDGELVGDRISGTYALEGGKPLPWTVAR